MVNPVNWFEIPVADMERAAAFYAQAFATTLEDMPVPGEGKETSEMQMKSFPMEWGKPGAAGALVKNERYNPGGRGVIIYLSTDDLEAALARVTEAGGAVHMQKTEIGEYGYIGMIEDTEGNHIGVHQNK